MKRFLRPSSTSSGASVPPTKLLKLANHSFSSANEVPTCPKRKNPIRFLSWNCNGIVAKIKREENWNKFTTFIKEKNPDVICFQEVKLIAWGPFGSKRGDGKPRDRWRLRCDDKENIEEKRIIEGTFTTDPFNQYFAFWSLADWRYSGTLTLVKKDIEIQGLRFNNDWSKSPDIHDEEGRVIAIEFRKFILLTTYSPNNGNEEKAFNKRKQWDAACLRWIEQINQLVERPNQSIDLIQSKCNSCHASPTVDEHEENIDEAKRSISDMKSSLSVNQIVGSHSTSAKISTSEDLSITKSSGIAPLLTSCGFPQLIHPTKPLIWIGDLNCAYEDIDLSDPKWFRVQDTRKVKHNVKNRTLPPEFVGQPGCTDAERQSFRRYFENGHMVDAFRHEQSLNPNSQSYDVGGPYYTWRGSPGTTQPERGKYYGKGMRVDHSLVHRSLVSYVCKTEICGRGAQRENFFNSDHSPIYLELKDTINE